MLYRCVTFSRLGKQWLDYFYGVRTCAVAGLVYIQKAILSGILLFVLIFMLDFSLLFFDNISTRNLQIDP